ncbi:MAG: hypothetical protein ACI8W3_000220 [Myxococcota bacterium]|jgi:hypothetical protein
MGATSGIVDTASAKLPAPCCWGALGFSSEVISFDVAFFRFAKLTGPCARCSSVYFDALDCRRAVARKE